MEDKSNKVIGFLGEDIASNFLEKKGFKIIEKNFLKKWGEIDLIAQKGKIIHFVEVKSVQYLKNFEQNPEENVHSKKLERLFRTIQTYLLEKNKIDDEWQLDVIAVFIDIENKTAKVRMTENIVIG